MLASTQVKKENGYPHFPPTEVYFIYDKILTVS